MTKLPALALLAVLLAALGAVAWLASRGERLSLTPTANLGVESPAAADITTTVAPLPALQVPPLPTLQVHPSPRHFAFVSLSGDLQDWPDRCVLTVRLSRNKASLRLLLDPSVCADERVWQWLQETP